MPYNINKGVGRSFEFKGLRTTYVFCALGGLIAAILFYFVCGLVLPFPLSISLVVLIAVGSIGGSYYLNAVYGEHGLALERAKRKLPQRVQFSRRVFCMLIQKKDTDEF